MPLSTTAARCFVAVAEGRSIRAAADVLALAPSAVNRHILGLEQELGVTLFERLSRGMRLSQAGELLLAHLHRVAEDRARFDDEVSSMSGALAGTIKVASVEACTHALIPQAVALLRAALPAMRVRLRVGTTDDVVGAVAGAEAEIGLALNAPEVRELRINHAVPLPIGAVVTPGHPLAARKAVRLDDCAPYPAILPDESLFGRSSIGMALTQGEADVKQAVAAYCNRYGAIMAMVRAGLGIGFLTRLDIGPEIAPRGAGLSFVPLHDARVSSSILSLVTSRRRRLGEPASRLALHLERLMNQLLQDASSA